MSETSDEEDSKENKPLAMWAFSCLLEASNIPGLKWGVYE